MGSESKKVLTVWQKRVQVLNRPASSPDLTPSRECGEFQNKSLVMQHITGLLKACFLFFFFCQGHMVAKGTYTELQRSGVDFTSLLKKDEEEEQQQQPTPPPPTSEIPIRARTLSQTSALSQTSSVQSVKDGDHLPVGTAYL